VVTTFLRYPLATAQIAAFKFMHILHVIGARPNFMKFAPVWLALNQREAVLQTVVHTGQHYDFSMSDIFFQQLAVPPPDINLQVGSASHAQQTASIIQRFEPVVLERNPDVVLVYGDVNSTLAAALVCAKLGIKIGHVEAGLRSFDRSMPEEINRLVTDQLADQLFTPSLDGSENLIREGIDSSKIFLVGNVMIDTLQRLLPLAHERWKTDSLASGLDRYCLVTLHRPSNVDDPDKLEIILSTLEEISRDIPVIFPIHPRTAQRLGRTGAKSVSTLHFCDPVGYVDFLALQVHATLVITDSGGIQEETTCTGVPCLTIRENTERPVTVTIGTNVLVGTNMERLKREVRNILLGKAKQGGIPPLWNGHAGERIAEIIAPTSRQLSMAAA
jgi:UDP-N-acetylglucosamine 2-epimerase (non-hydrolysing)